MQYQEEHGYDKVKRLFIALAALIGWIVSFHYSVKGFGVQVPDDRWAAYGLVILFTGLELAFSRTRLKLAATLILGAFVAYGYGIWTNVLGIYVMMHPEAISLAGATWDNLIIPVTAGTGLEVIPEALFVYALAPHKASEVSDSMGNFISVFKNLFGNIGEKLGNAWDPPRRARPTQQPYQSASKSRYKPQHHPNLQPAPMTPQSHPVGGYRVPSYYPSNAALSGLVPLAQDDEDEA